MLAAHCHQAPLGAGAYPEMSRLVEMLLQAGALTPERAKEARGHQVVFGDRIGTNLIALGFVNELTLVQALGALHNLPFAAGRDAESRPQLTRALPRQTAARLSVVPARADESVVHVFTMDPLKPEALNELQAHFKRPVAGVIVAEARMWALLNKFYLVKRGMRALRLDDEDKRTTLTPRSAERQASSVSTTVDVSGEGLAVSAPSRGPVAPAMVPAGAVRGGPVRPVDTSWINSVLPAATSMPPMPPLTQPPAMMPPAMMPTAMPTVPTTTMPPQPAPSTFPPPMRAAAPPPPAAPVREASATWLPTAPKPGAPVRFDALVVGALPSAGEPLDLVELEPEGPATPTTPPTTAPTTPMSTTTAPASLSMQPLFAEADIPFDELVEDALVEEAIVLGDLVDDAPAEDVSPLDFDAARKALSGVEDRKTISRIVLRYAMSRVKRALLLTVQGRRGSEEAFGWDALGEGLRPGLTHDIRLSLTEASVLQLARESRAHVLGPLGKTAVNDELVSLLGGKAPKTAFVVPILARGRVINLLYLDNGPGRFMEPDIGELLILTQQINKSYEKLLQSLAN